MSIKQNWNYQRDGYPDMAFYEDLGHIYRDAKESCPFCQGSYNKRSEDDELFPIHIYYGKCLTCGFDYKYAQENWVSRNDNGPIKAHGRQIFDVAALKRLSLNDTELGLSELGTHLKRRFGDVWELSPRRFEELVGNVYSNLGYDVLLTPQTRDGGYDLLLLGKNKEKIIVEAKRYSSTNKVGIGAVNVLLGVQTRKGIQRAKIVTTSTFAAPAMSAAEEAREVAKFEFELVDADAFLGLLDVYNEKLPPLSIEDLIRE